MGFGDRTEPHSESSRKGKLSFVLNGDDEGAGPGHSHQRHRSSSSSGSGRQQGNPAGYEYGRGSGEHATSPALMVQSRSTTRQPYAAPDGAAGHRGHSAADAPGAEKRGVRKKRQRKFACDTCGFGFYTNSDLQKHVSSVHLLLRPYDCSMCDKKFGERSNATKHFKSVHERQKNAACHLCHKVFAFKDGLVRHIRLVHQNVRNFHCPYPECGQAFKQSAHLKKHEQVHTRSRNRALAARKEAGRRSTRT